MLAIAGTSLAAAQLAVQNPIGLRLGASRADVGRLIGAAAPVAPVASFIHEHDDFDVDNRGQWRCRVKFRAVPDNFIKSTPPPVCPSCGSVTTVKLEKTIKGASSSLLWHCTRCDHRWPVKADSIAA